MRKLLFLVLGHSLFSAAHAEDRHIFTSGTHQTPLVELYTSEGCSSCPPADQWFSKLAQAPGLWTEFVPVAFHVTYWNYLGWDDRFSQKSFDQRQQRRARSAGAVVYTPGIFLAGDEYRSWRFNRKAPSKSDQLAGQLTITVSDGQVDATYTGAETTQQPRLELAMLASNQTTDVRSGENRGRTLAHDFVVATLAQHPMQRQDDQWSASFTLPETVEFEANGLAAWVSDDNGVPLQATGGWLD